MSLITSDLTRAIHYAYQKAQENNVAMEIYSRPVYYSSNEDEVTDVEDKQYIATPNISDEVPDNWVLEIIIGVPDISMLEGELCDLQS